MTQPTKPPVIHPIKPAEPVYPGWRKSLEFPDGVPHYQPTKKPDTPITEQQAAESAMTSGALADDETEDGRSPSA